VYWVLDIGFREDESRIRGGRFSEICLQAENLRNFEKSSYSLENTQGLGYNISKINKFFGAGCDSQPAV